MMTRAKEGGVEVSEKKEMINTLSKFQLGLEKIDSYHHGQLPPLYRKVPDNLLAHQGALGALPF